MQDFSARLRRPCFRLSRATRIPGMLRFSIPRPPAWRRRRREIVPKDEGPLALEEVLMLVPRKESGGKEPFEPGRQAGKPGWQGYTIAKFPRCRASFDRSEA